MAKKKTTSKKATKPKKKTVKRKSATKNKDGLNSQQLAFCKNVANGMNNTRAYMAAYKGVRSDKVATNSAHRLLTNEGVIQKVEELREAVETKSTLSRLETKQFLKRVVVTPITDLENHQDNDCGDLVQETSTTINESGSETTKVKGMSKLDAIKINNAMSGFNEPDKIEVNNTGTIAMSPIEFVCQNAKTLAARKKNKKS